MLILIVILIFILYSYSYMHRIDDATTYHGASLGALYALQMCLLTATNNQEEAYETFIANGVEICQFVAHAHVGWGKFWGTAFDTIYKMIVTNVHPKFLGKW